jgi:tetratricopeptide (TPR) repeat protein
MKIFFYAIVVLSFLGCATEDRIERSLPDLPEARLESISSALLMGDADKAIKAHEKAFKDAPQTTTTQVLHARLLILAARVDEAKVELELVLAKEPDNTDALFAKSLIEGLSGDKKSQKEILERVLILNPAHLEALTTLGSLYLDDKFYDKAKELFLKVTEKDGNNLVALLGLGNIDFKQKDFNEAKNYFDIAIQAEPEYPFSYSDRAQVRHRLGDLEAALSDLDMAVKLEPDYPYNYYDRGRIFMECGKSDEAILQFDKAIEKDPEMFIAYVIRAGLYDDAGKTDQAISDYRTVIKLHYDYFCAYPELGTLYLLKNEYGKAFTMFDTASIYDKENYAYVLLAVLALKKADKNAEALKYLNDKLPEIPRQTWCFAVAQFYLDTSFDYNAVQAAKQEKNKIIRAQILFYIAEQYLLLNKKPLAQTYLYECAGVQRKGLIEKRLAQCELNRLSIN